MKKQLIIALAFSISAFTFAQKKELKLVESAIKSGNYAEAKKAMSQVEPLISSMDAKTKSKYYFLKGKVLYSNGYGSSEDIKMAVEVLNKVEGSSLGAAKELKTSMLNGLRTKGNDAYEKGDYVPASTYFESAYRASENDTIFLDYAAVTALYSKQYKRSLGLYDELTKLGYTGIATEYFVTNKKTNEEEKYDKRSRDLLVTQGTHINPVDRVSKSKTADIVKNIAIIYLSLDEKEKAIQALNAARKQNPDDVDLILSQANVYYKMGNEAKFKDLLEEATKMDPNNPELFYNIGVVSMNQGQSEKAKESFEKVLSLDPSNSDAAINLSNHYIGEGNVVIEEMGKLGMSKADDAKYEVLKVERDGFYQQGADLLTGFISKNPNPPVGILKQLKNIYSALGEVEKTKELKAKIATMTE